jgi:trk system potassium uptake protein TrkH
MNFGIVKNILGKILILLAALMVLPLVVSFIYQEGIKYYLAYAIPIAVLIIVGILLNLKKAKSSKMLVREGMIIVGTSWIIMSLFGCLPYIITKEIPNFFDALFEMASGFTTTGASIVTNVESLSHSVLFWRSFSHWIGGMGVLVFILAIIPESKDGSALHILRAESPGPQVGRLVSKMASSSRILYIIYISLTLLEFLFLWLGPDSKMDLFSSIIYSLGTAGTGGFAAHADSLASFSPYSQYVVSVFMLIFGINFTMFYLLLIRNVKEVSRNTELKVYFITVLVSVLIICFNIYPIIGNVEETFRQSLFQVASIISTTGFATVDFNSWPALSKVVIIMIMCFGGCAGSTAGGFKISRITILFKSAISRMKKMVRPRKVETIYMDGKPLTDDTIDSVSGYLVVYVLVFIVCTFLITIYNPNIPNLDLETSFTASLTCLNNVGPGLGAVVGPVGNFASFSNFSKLILTIEMIAGRLELFPVLLLFSPNMWKKRN